MADTKRSHVAYKIMTALPKFGLWATSARDFETPYGRVGFRQAAILWQLRSGRFAREGTSPTKLAESFLVQPSVITGALAKLEANGLITRTVSALDARQSLIKITEKGRQLSEHVEGFYLTEIGDLIKDLDENQFEELERSLETLDRIGDQLLRRRVEKLTRRGMSNTKRNLSGVRSTD